MGILKPRTRPAALAQLSDEQIASALPALIQSSRLLVFLVDVERRSYAEAASMAGVHAEAVAARLHQARGSLMRRLLSTGRPRRQWPTS